MKQKISFHQEVADKLIDQLKKGTAPWQKPWTESHGSMMPVNGVTGNPYKGANVIHLLAESINKEYTDPRWMTYKQAQSINAQVKKGSKATTVQHWKFTEDKIQTNPETGKKEKVTLKLDRPRIYYASVFNASQIDGLEPHKKIEFSWNPLEKAESILSTSKAVINHLEGDRAFYSPRKDEITLPNKKQFDSPDRYYATALHELSHWTGHPSRLNRDTLSHPFGSEEYAREELRAEIGSMMLGMNLGIGHDPGQHAAYVQSWIKVLEDNPREIFSAAKDAEKIMAFVLEISKEVRKEQNITVETSTSVTTEKKYIAVPYEEKDQAKQKGARWDSKAKSWYVPPGKEVRYFSKWTGNNQKTLSIEEEFKQSLNKAGLIIDGKPLMDGKFHRVAVENGQPGSLDGTYKGFLDGVPAGFIQNHKTGLKQNWKASGYSISEQQKEKLTVDAKKKNLERTSQKKEAYQKVAKACQNVWGALPEASNHPYLSQKQIKAHGIKSDFRGNLVIPIRDVSGQMMSFQKIHIAGKSMEKGGQLKGGMHKIGDFENKPCIAVAEGYATAASVHQATGLPVAVAFSCSNLEAVAKSLKQAYGSQILICADNDRATEQKIGVNPGVEAAKKVAKEVGGDICVPRFTSNESGKDFSDFNDLHRSRGLETVKRQINLSLSKQKSTQEINQTTTKEIEKAVAIKHREKPRSNSKGFER